MFATMLGYALSPAGRFAAIVLAGLLLSAGGYVKGRHDGSAIARQQATEASFAAIKKRIETNAEVDKMDDAHLCAAIGGVWRGGTCN